jgi:hypothetical protein
LWDKKVSPSNIFAYEASSRAFFGAETSLQNKIQFKGTVFVGKDDSHHLAT